MKPILTKLAPTGLILALIVYCCDLPAGDRKVEKPIDKAQSFDAKLLASTSAPAPNRDPFGLKDEIPPAPPAKRNETSGPIAAVTPAKKDSIESTKHAAKVNLSGLVSGLSLKATCASENGGTALINGKFYNQGDTVKSKDSVALVVDRVYEDRVLLRHGDETAELKFPAAETKSARPKTTKPTARAKSARPITPHVQE
jgi:hypothetical protein